MEKNANNSAGATILESVIAIALVFLLILIYSAVNIVINTSQNLKNKNLAYQLASEEIEALRSVPFSLLTNRVDSNFIEVIYNVGTWSVQTHATAPSSPNTYHLLSPSGNPTGVTGVAAVPGFEYDDFTYETNIYSKTGSPANWQVGIYARYHDKNNYYQVYFTSSNLYIKKKVDGTESTLNSKLKSFSTNTWYALKLVANSNSFDIYINDILELSATDTDNSFTKGRLALFGGNSIEAFFDDVSVTASTTNSWNFDSDTVGSISPSWQRFGINDLPSGTTKLTIEDAEASYEDIKDITARVEWNEKTINKYVEIKTLITLKQ